MTTANHSEQYLKDMSDMTFIVKTFNTFEVWHKVPADNEDEAIVKAVASDKYVQRVKFHSCSEDDAESEPLEEHNEWKLEMDLTE
jgi:hypothetical protein